MREGWIKRKLGDAIALAYGKPLPDDQRCEEGGFPAYGANGVKCFAAKPYCNFPSIIVGRKGTAGAVNLVDGGFWPLDVTYYVTFDGDQYDLKFLFYMLSALDLPSLATGVKPGINRNTIYAIEKYFPPIAEQKRIVAILDEAFAGIATAVANTEKNLANARELFESYLRAAMDAAINNGELAVLADLATEITDGDHMPPPKAPSGIPFVTIKNIDKKTRKIDFDDTFSVPRDYFDRLKANKRPQEGDVLYTVTGSFGIPVLVEQKTDFCFQRHIGLIRPRSDTNSRWLYYLLLSPQLVAQAIERATGTAQKTVSLKALRGFKVPVIQWNQQLTAVQGLDELSNETERLESIYRQKLSALAELKQSLLQKAFSGELTATPQAEFENVLA
jgi:type I restriction enzyme, S subunit